MSIIKIKKFLLLTILTLFLAALVSFSSKKGLHVLLAISSGLICLSLEYLLRSIQDFFDDTNWKTTQRKLQRGGFLKGDTLVRISFAYLFRIKSGSEYLLVRNERGTGKYQPVGGVYKMYEDEKMELKRLYHITDDDRIPIDESSRDDYRLMMHNKYLRKFVKRFDSKDASRERVDNLSREFNEELINKGIINWKTIDYRYCGRHITDLKYSNHFKCYELLLADVVEVLLSDNQEQNLAELKKRISNYYIFATPEEIKSYGVHPGTNNLVENIADHSVKVLQETEDQLTLIPQNSTIYSVKLNNYPYL